MNDRLKGEIMKEYDVIKASCVGELRAEFGIPTSKGSKRKRAPYRAILDKQR